MSVNELLAAITGESALEAYARAYDWRNHLLPLHLPTLDQLLARLLAESTTSSRQVEESPLLLSTTTTFPVVLFHGGPDTGKSQLLHFIALVYALPSTFTIELREPTATQHTSQANVTATTSSSQIAVETGGRGQGVIFLDLHQEFDVQRIKVLAEQHFDRCLEIAELAISTTTTTTITSSIERAHELYSYEKLADYKGAREQFVNETLARILVNRVTSTEQLLVVLHRLARHLRNETELDYGAIIVDPVNAFYWREKTTGELTIEARAIRDLFRQLATEWSLAVFASSRIWIKRRPLMFNQGRRTDSDPFNGIPSSLPVDDTWTLARRRSAITNMDAWPGWWRDIPVTWLFLLERVATQTNITDATASFVESDEVDASLPSVTVTHFEARLLTRHGETTEDTFQFEVADDGVFC
ncbi:hypothetical protein BDF22DRAFT_695480 [Syncephalis plumigaleata]|nr:hypothetical protein BDF22DRAFT_695480 [Syncephalis plumigaleata]